MKATEYSDENGLHCHMCERCGCVWQHPNSKAGNEKAHKCPRLCGGEQWYKMKLSEVTHIDVPWER